MRFKDPKTGEVFEDIKTLFETECSNNTHCLFCTVPIAFRNRTDCRIWFLRNPAEAARLMGYEVVEEQGVYTRNEEIQRQLKRFDIKPPRPETEVNMDKQKPLKDWTLGELQVYCGHVISTDDKNECQTCAFQKYIGCCPFDCAPCDWDLTENTRFTEEEVADARAIMRLFPWAETLEKQDNIIRVSGTLDNGVNEGMEISFIKTNALSWLKDGTAYKISEIVGGEA